MDGNAHRLAREQDALRRIEALTAAQAPIEAVFEAVVGETTALLVGTTAVLAKYDSDGGAAVTVAESGGLARHGERFPMTGDGIGVRIIRSRRCERIDDFAAVAAPAAVRALGLLGAVAAPVTVFGELWGWLGVWSRQGPLPYETEDMLTMFAGIVGSAVVNLQTVHSERRLVREQAALLRVTALVARDAPSVEVFDAVTAEAAGLIDDEATTLVRYEGGRNFRVLSTRDGPAPVGTRLTVPEDDGGTTAELMRTLQPARRDRYDDFIDRSYSREYGVGSSVSVPVMVDGRLWGVLGTVNEGRRLPEYTEDRLATFAELVSTALSNLEARAKLERSAREQGALRRVAELVARGAALDEVFGAIAAEASSILADAATHLARYDEGDGITVVATCNSPVPVGLWTPTHPGGTNATLRETAAPMRIEPFGEADELPRRYGISSLVIVPVTVEGEVWGLLGTTAGEGPLPEDAENRLTEFAELAAAAIANAENKAALRASRARVVATADETRQRMQRDVHDGVQQRLVQTVLTLQLALDAVERGEPGGPGLVREALNTAQRATGELRDLVQGILPASLTRGGLQAGLESLLADLALPVELRMADGPARLPREVEVTAYFVVAEALTNVLKHARSTQALVTVTTERRVLVVEVTDDGRGGADARRGTGLTGLQDRVDALDGTLELSSVPGAGTTLRVRLPLGL